MKYIFPILLLAIFTSCLGDGVTDPNPIPDVGDIIIADGEIEKIPVQPGEIYHTVQLNNNLGFDLLIHFPDTLDNPALILALHWAGYEEDYKTYGPCQAIAGLASTEAIIVVPSSPGGIWWNPQMDILMMDMLEKMITAWNVNPKQIALTGYSNGATATWLYADKYPDVFSAAIPVSGSYANSFSFNIPLYVIHGENDELFSLTYTQGVIDGSINKGSDIQFIVADGRSHYEGCNFVPFLEGAADWLVEDVWK
jgi:hypothetical protein